MHSQYFLKLQKSPSRGVMVNLTMKETPSQVFLKDCTGSSLTTYIFQSTLVWFFANFAFGGKDYHFKTKLL